MKAIILAAGEGTRLKKYTQKIPKGMLEFQGKTLIKHQIETLKSAGIDDISIVKGFKADTINYPGIKYYVNKKYDKTNMVESLLEARQEFNDDIIVTYADILYDKTLIEKAIISPYDIGVLIDTNWEEYWKERYGSLEYDLESLKVNGNQIISLGEDVSTAEDIDGRYVGIVKFTQKGLYDMLQLEPYKVKKSENWMVSNKSFYQIHMTDLLQGMINKSIPVHAIKVKNGWIEFDTNNDYELMNKWSENCTLTKFLDLSRNR